MLSSFSFRKVSNEWKLPTESAIEYPYGKNKPLALTVARVPGSQILDAMSFDILLCLFYELWKIRNRYAMITIRKLP